MSDTPTALLASIMDALPTELSGEGWPESHFTYEGVEQAISSLLADRDTLEKAAADREHQYTEALKSLLVECEPDPVDPRHSAESKAFREGSNSDRRVQAKLILAAATSLGIDLTK